MDPAGSYMLVSWGYDRSVVGRLGMTVLETPDSATIGSGARGRTQMLHTIRGAIIPFVTCCVVLVGARVSARAQSSLDSWGKLSFQSSLSPYVDVATGSDHTLVRHPDGTVEGWGDNLYFQCNVPGLPSGLTYVEVAGGYN